MFFCNIKNSQGKPNLIIKITIDDYSFFLKETNQKLSNNNVKIDAFLSDPNVKRYLDGETVFHGELSDSGDYGGMIEAFYSHESLVVIGDDIYLNMRNSVY